MNILNESNVRKLDIDLINFLFHAKCAMLEELEEHSSGMFSTQNKLLNLKRELLDFIMTYKNRESIFYIFFNEESEESLKLVVSNLTDEPNEVTKRFAIIVDENLAGLRIKQLSVSGRVLTLILNGDE